VAFGFAGKKQVGMRPKETTMWYSAVGCLVTLILSLLATPLAAEVQQPGQMPRIGFVEPGSAAVNGHFLAAFRQGLRALGWVEGQNLVIEDRWAEGQVERFPALVAELIQLKVQVLVVSSSGGGARCQAGHRDDPDRVYGGGGPR